MVVGGSRDGDAQQVLVFVHGLQNRREDKQELRVLLRRVAGVQKIFAAVGGKRPVVVLARAVHARERLFVQQAHHAVPVRHALHALHDELVVIGGDVHRGIDARELVLRGGDLVVLGLGRDAEPPELLVQLAHESRHARLDRAEIMVVQLLSLGRARAEKRTPGVDQVGALLVNAAVNEEILLLRAGVRAHGGGLRVAEELQNAQRLDIQRVHTAEKRRFLVDGLTAVGGEYRRDAEHAVLHESVARRIPGGVAARLECGAKTAGREARGVRLTVDELAARKLRQRAAVLRRGEKAVVLFGGDAGHRLEPVGIMRRAALDRPVAHCLGDDVRLGKRQALAVLPGRAQRAVDLRRETLLHDGIRKYHRAEFFCHTAHKPCPFYNYIVDIWVKTPSVTAAPCSLPYRGEPSGFAENDLASPNRGGDFCQRQKTEGLSLSL